MKREGGRSGGGGDRERGGNYRLAEDVFLHDVGPSARVLWIELPFVGKFVEELFDVATISCPVAVRLTCCRD